MRTIRRHKPAGLTLTEVMVVITGLAILIGLLLPAFARTRCNRPIYFDCLAHLKQTGNAFRLWASDNNDKFPQQYVGNPLYPLLNETSNWPTANGAACPLAFRVFQSMSNELSTPKIVVCSGDLERKPATNFAADFNNSHVSYFVGVDADPTKETMIIAGDRNLQNPVQVRNGTMILSTNQMVKWAKGIHAQKGNIALVDGSVQRVDNQGLQKLLLGTGVETNRLLMP
jgi:prepilin-type processing-associated H-X9-DG protein